MSTHVTEHCQTPKVTKAEQGRLWVCSTCRQVWACLPNPDMVWETGGRAGTPVYQWQEFEVNVETLTLKLDGRNVALALEQHNRKQGR